MLFKENIKITIKTHRVNWTSDSFSEITFSIECVFRFSIRMKGYSKQILKNMVKFVSNVNKFIFIVFFKNIHLSQRNWHSKPYVRKASYSLISPNINKILWNACNIFKSFPSNSKWYIIESMIYYWIKKQPNLSWAWKCKITNYIGKISLRPAMDKTCFLQTTTWNSVHPAVRNLYLVNSFKHGIKKKYFDLIT